MKEQELFEKYEFDEDYPAHNRDIPASEANEYDYIEQDIWRLNLEIYEEFRQRDKQQYIENDKLALELLKGKEGLTSAIQAFRDSMNAEIQKMNHGRDTIQNELASLKKDLGVK